MKNISENIIRFKKLSGLVLEQQTEGCVVGKCKGEDAVGKFVGGDFEYEGYFNQDGKFTKRGLWSKYTDNSKKDVKFIYQGEFIDGTTNGNGELYHNTNSYIFNGKFEKNKKITGIYKKYNSVKLKQGNDLLYTYVGNFDSNGNFTGKGKITFIENDKVYDLYFENGNINYDGKSYTIDEIKKVLFFNGLGELKSDEKTPTNDFHTPHFYFKGNFKNGVFDGQGSITFNDRITYNGNFTKNRINGMGTFTFPDGSSYEGIVKTYTDPKGKIKYKLSTTNRTIDDVIKFNESNTVQKIVYDDSSENFSPNEFIRNVKLRIVFSLGDETKVVDEIDKTKYKPINKQLVFKLKNTVYKEAKYNGSTRTGEIVLNDIKSGPYNLIVDVVGYGRYEQVIDLNKEEEVKTFIMKDNTIKEDLITKKIIKLLFEQQSNECPPQDKIKEFQDWMDDNHKGWFEPEFEFNMDKNVDAGYGECNDQTKKAWESYKNEFLGNKENVTTPTKDQSLNDTEKKENEEIIDQVINNVVNDEVIDEKPENKNKLIEFFKSIPSIAKDVKDAILKFLSYSNIKIKEFLIYLRKFGQKINNVVFKQIVDFIKKIFKGKNEEPTNRDNIKNCERRIEDFYNTFLGVWQGRINVNSVTSTENIKKEKKSVTSCTTQYGNKFNNKTKKILKYLINIPPGTDNSVVDFEDLFEIDVEVNENVDIYNKTNNMSISNSIRKVLSEQSEKTKSVLVEKEIIENRINYVLNSTNKINKKTVVIKESNNLLKSGYDKKLIKEVAKKYLN